MLFIKKYPMQTKNPGRPGLDDKIESL